MKDVFRNLTAKKLLVAAACALTIGLTPNWEYEIKHLDRVPVLGVAKYAPATVVHAAPELAAVVDKPGLSARAVLAYDHKSGSILYTQDFDDQLPVASLTKIVSALVIVESGLMNTAVEVQETDVRVIGANTGLVPGERILVSELLKAMLIASHNDSTRALARHVGGDQEGFVRLMNAKAQALGMQSTNFVNANGFDDPNHYSSAQDLSLALREFLANPKLNDIVATKDAEIRALNMPFGHRIMTTNKLLLEDERVVGVKTGYTTEAKGNLVVRSIDGDVDIVTIVLGSDDREGDSRKVLDWIYSVYRW